MKNHARLAVMFLLCLVVSSFTWADDDTDDQDKIPFVFGNHIDLHQTAVLRKDNTLKGTFKIVFTGDFNDQGIPKAKHCDANTPPDQCVVGWKLRGIPGDATFVYHNMDHPVWFVDDRNEIPQPGAYAFYHWITMDSNDEREVPDIRCNVAQAAMLQRGAHCPGYFLQLKAVRTFVFIHGNDEILIREGLDVASHMNIITSLDPSAALLD